jgi:hypothetical protein
MPEARRYPRWPIAFIALPSAALCWSGWIGLAAMCGFGVVHPLQGVWDALRINTAILLPIGVEAYAAYALGAWLTHRQVPKRARTFAVRSAIGALALGWVGQASYHILAAHHTTTAPWYVILPVTLALVCTIGFGVTLGHMLHPPAAAPRTAPTPRPGPRPKARPDARPDETPEVPGTGAAVSLDDAAMFYARHLADGQLPTHAMIRADFAVGSRRTKEIQAHLRGLLPGGQLDAAKQATREGASN